MNLRRYLLLTLFLAVPFAALAADVAADAAPDAASERGPLRLTLRRAIEIALSPEGNTYIQLSDENVRQAKSRSAEARAAFLPDVEASASESGIMRSLADLGVSEALDGLKLPLGLHLSLPKVVGPFDIVDVRATAAMSMFDFGNIRRYQSSRAAIRAAKADRGNTDDSVSSTVAKAYLNALRADADVEAYQADVGMGEAVLKQTENQKAAGTGTGIEVTRAKVQLSNDQQRLLGVQNERNKAYLELLRAMGMNLGTQLELTDKLSYQAVDPITVDEAKAEAFKSRSDLKAEEQRESAARLNASAVKYERLPSVVSFADYGTTGPNGAVPALFPTRDYGISVRVPIFDGGRRDARRAESASQFRQERVRANDLREQVELEIRTALDTLHSAEAQFKVAEDGLALSDSELTQARRRYAAGFASSLEVTDAQTRLDRARDNRIDALFSYNVARIDLGKAMGNVRRMIP
jgi:outer membrane protein